MITAPADPVSDVSTDATPGPITQHTRKRLGQKAYGIVFLVILALLLRLAIASFQKRFTPVVLVTLETDRLGTQLQASTHVNLRRPPRRGGPQPGTTPPRPGL